jgi:hypothetical protein
MRHANLALTFALTLLASACGGISNPTADSPDDIAIDPSTSSDTRAAKRSTDRADSEEAAESEAAAAPLAERQVGDFFVHRFSGSFAKEPMTLTEEVVARAGGLIVIEYTLEQGKHKQELRVTHDAATERVLRVREIRGGQEMAAKIEDFEAMLAKTAFVTDSNDKTLASEKGTCVVSGDEVECQKTSYSVAIGDKTATMSVTQSAAVPGRDLPGEIVDKDGKIIYRAELVDMGRGTPDGVASAE